MRVKVLLLLFLFGTAALQAQPSKRNLLFQDIRNRTEVDFGYRFRAEDEALLPADGRGLSQGEFRARASHALDSLHRVEGGASYERGVKRSVNWNTSSDWELLCPYVTVDTVGGDLQKEQYRFHARYAARPGRFFYSAALSYRALHEYRAVDPRPRNVTDDLLASAAGGLTAGAYAYSLEASYRKYHQNSSVEFMDPMGYNTAVFHNLGLGRYYQRFSGGGSTLSARFRGNGFSLMARMEPLGKEGWLVEGAYSLLSVLRLLTGQNDAPISTLYTHDASLSVAHLGLRNTLSASLSYQLKQGMENVIDNSSAFRELLALSLYRQNRLEASLDALHRWELSSTLEGTLSAKAFYRSLEARSAYPGALFSFSHLGADVTGAVRHHRGRWEMGSSLLLGVRLPAASALELREGQAFEDYYAYLHERLSGRSLCIGTDAQFIYALRKDLQLSLSPQALLTLYAQSHYRVMASLHFGIIF